MKIPKWVLIDILQVGTAYALFVLALWLVEWI